MFVYNRLVLNPVRDGEETNVSPLRGCRHSRTGWTSLES